MKRILDVKQGLAEGQPWFDIDSSLITMLSTIE